MAKFVANGTTLSKGDGASPEGFTVLPGMVDFNGPQITAPEVDATNLDSTAREFFPGLKDNGAFDATLHLDPANPAHQALINDIGDQTAISNYRLTFPNSAGTGTFAAFVSGAPISGGVDQMVTMAASFRITGDVTWVWS